MVYYDMLWHIMTYYDILRHIMTYYDILRHIMTYYDILWHISKYYDILQHIMKYYNILWHITTYHITTYFWEILRNGLPAQRMILRAADSIIPFLRKLFHFGKGEADSRGAKSVATWQPSCQKVFEGSGSDRKFLDLSPILSCNLTIWW